MMEWVSGDARSKKYRNYEENEADIGFANVNLSVTPLFWRILSASQTPLEKY